MRYKIVLVPFPFDGFIESKLRPAVCLTEKIGSYQHIIVAFITSQPPIEIFSRDIVLFPDFENGLKVKSFIRLHRITTVPFSIITRELGVVPKEKQSEILIQLKLLLNS